MDVSVDSLLADAKFLVGRLKGHDSAAEELADQTAALQRDIEARNTYQENLKLLNKVAGHRPRSALVLGMQQENCEIRSLQNENQELLQSLTDHQNAIEFIMTKYRHQMVQFMNDRNLLQVFPADGRFSSEEKKDLLKTQMLMDKQNCRDLQIYEMAAVMQKAIHIDEDSQHAQEEHISRLEAENHGLRELLLITKNQSGSQLTSDEDPVSNAAQSSDRNTVIDSDHRQEDGLTSHHFPTSEDTLT